MVSDPDANQILGNVRQLNCISEAGSICGLHSRPSGGTIGSSSPAMPLPLVRFRALLGLSEGSTTAHQ